ncbi:MAG: glycogen-binding domain-containing protein [Treponemataceae bacterium]|uniref:glycogen-binding domain-containing protein n=1 Tax=Treponema sp. J25 TaxID=2094121 RepID=UPI00104AE0B0|nr:glycogen-binding domain-containing protein [Treponema sp. J25]MCX7949122.1 glycogen-binding domain-containing protein [Treponemataceae bacterium]TCW60138.1 isoamylase [Treponema sp. J25]
MKHLLCVLLCVSFIFPLTALDTQSYSFIDHLLSISQAKAPEIYEDGVIFTFPSTYRRVGIAFAHEGYSRVYWFKKLLKHDDIPPGASKNQSGNDLVGFKDSGILFYVYEYPREVRELQYRLVIDGLWQRDPLNPLYRTDPSTGLAYSVVTLPPPSPIRSTYDAPAGSLRFSFSAAPGERVTVAGSFNNWDPFMYELEEVSPGFYLLTLPLPPGKYQYVFFYRGERVLDPNNPRKVYTRDGRTASEAIVP